MRSAQRCAVLGVVLMLVGLLALPALAESAKSLFNKGRDAEDRQKYDEAYEYYRQAYQLKPKDAVYRTAYERMRFLGAAAHVHKGQILRDGGKLPEALAEFQKAYEIDPSSFIANQEIRHTQELMKAASTPAATPPPDPVERELDEAQGPPELAPLDTKPITLSMTEDAKNVFQTVGQLAGVNVMFDPDYTSHRITVKLANVTLEDALQIVALEARSFWKPVTLNTIFVANDTPTKRTELEQQVMKTFYLSNLSEATELQDVMNSMRTVLNLQRVVMLASRGAIVVRGTPDQIALAQKLIDDIDKARPEVVIDVAVLQVSRNKMNELGIKPPTSATVQLQSNVSTTPSTTTTGTTTTTPTTGTPGSINLNKFQDLKATDFLVTIPGATATALMSDSTTKIIQNPQIRASNNQKASLKIGQRIPVATGSFQPGIGGVGINPLVNTQFQYLDVGVNIDVQPRVHADNEVSMKLTLEISSVASHVTIGGIDQPVIGQNKIDHEIRLKEGEINLLGGIMENQQTKTLSGFPGLANIPILKYLFSDTTHSTDENEIVFLLVPHIVRGLELTEMNERALDVGSGNNIELRRGHVTTPAAPTAAAPTTAPTGIASVPSPLGRPPATSPKSANTNPAAANPADAPSVLLDPPDINAASGSTFAVNISLKNAHDVSTAAVDFNYDNSKLQLLNVSNGSLLSKDGQVVVLTHGEDPEGGHVRMSASRPPGAAGVSGDGPVFTLTFLARAAGVSSMTARGSARTPANAQTALPGARAAVTVK